MIPQAIAEETCAAELERRWLISSRLAIALIRMNAEIPGGLTIFSGHRSIGEQEALIASGAPAAPVLLSTHVVCPAEGADVRFTIGGANLECQSRIQFGAAAVLAGLRWGGGSPMTGCKGLTPSDWNHLDHGPLRA